MASLPQVGRRLTPTHVKADLLFGGRSRDELDFLPAALQIVETPAPPLPRVAGLALSAFLFAAIGWACIGQVDVVASAPGKLVPAGGSKVVQPLESGTVTAIRVHDGQRVRKGQVLIELDPTESRADRDRLRGELDGAALDVQRLQAVALGRSFPSGPSSDASVVVRREANAQREALRDKLEAIDREVEQHRAEIAEAEAEIARSQALLPINAKTTAIYQALASKGYGTTVQLLAAQEKEEDTRRQIEVERRKVPELRAAIGSLLRQRAEAMAETSGSQLGDLASAQVKAASLRQQLTGAEQRLTTRTLRAPVDGTIQELAIHTIGGVVEPGQTLLRIAPVGVGVEVQAKLRNQDVGFVRPGLPATVKVEAFPFTRYGTIAGRVETISADADSDRRADGSEELTYLIRVRLARDAIKLKDGAVLLEPGMAVTAEIKTGRRSVISFIISPVVRSLKEAGHEQ